jgi:hypothetical protein
MAAGMSEAAPARHSFREQIQISGSNQRGSGQPGQDSGQAVGVACTKRPRESREPYFTVMAITSLWRRTSKSRRQTLRSSRLRDPPPVAVGADVVLLQRRQGFVPAA